MKLTLLSPQFVTYQGDGRIHHVETIAEATGLMFLCPKCFKCNGGPVRTHQVLCWTPKVPLDVSPGPGRWELKGSGYGDLSLFAKSSSVKLNGGCNWHGFVTNGEVSILDN